MNKVSLKRIAVVLTLCMSVMVGCGANPKTASGEDVIVINYGHGFMPDTPQHKSAVMFKEKVEKESNGKVQVNVFPSSQLGSAREMFEGLQLGTQEVALVPTGRISGFAPQLQLFDLPYLFPNREVAYKVLDGEVGNELLNSLEGQFVKGVAFYEDGFKKFTSNKEISEVKDFKGVKFRTMESPILMGQFKSLGSNPVPIDFSELYNSLQLGVVDGQENPLVTIENMKFQEVQKYLVNSDHGYLAHVLLFNKLWYDKLPKDIQDVLYKAGREACVWEREEVARVEEKALKTIKAAGCKVVNFTDEQKSELEKVTKPVHQEYVKMFGDSLLNKTYSEVERIEDSLNK